MQIVSPCEMRGGRNGLSYGLGPAGYDVTVEFDSDGFSQGIVLGIGEFVLASTIEWFTMPMNVMGIVHDKSTWARRGLAVQNTVLEPGWRGHLTLELSNHGVQGLVINRGDPIAQIVFHEVDEAVLGYMGKYQGQGRGPQESL